MTTYAEMQAAVVSITKRPELVDLTRQAIQMATIRAHHVDFFARDLRSVQLNYTLLNADELFVDFPDAYTLVPRLRKPQFIQGEDLLSAIPTENLGWVDDYKDFYDVDNRLQNSVFTLVGDTLRVRFAGATGRARLYYYQNPNVDPSGYSSWIADNHKDEVAFWAACIIWMRSGFQETAQQGQLMIQGFKDLLVTSYLKGKV